MKDCRYKNGKILLDKKEISAEELKQRIESGEVFDCSMSIVNLIRLDYDVEKLEQYYTSCMVSNANNETTFIIY